MMRFGGLISYPIPPLSSRLCLRRSVGKSIGEEHDGLITIQRIITSLSTSTPCMCDIPLEESLGYLSCNTGGIS